MAHRKVFVRGRDGALADAETGEIEDGSYLTVKVEKATRSPFGRDWYSMARQGSAVLAERGHEIGLDGFRVFHALMSVLDYENDLHVSQTAIAQRLGMHPPNVARAIKRLVGVGVVLCGPRIGNHASYRLNPEYGWRGTTVSHRVALQDRMRKAKLRVVT